MIVIFSKADETSTDMVMKWLLKWNKKMTRFNKEDEALSIDVNLTLNNEEISIYKNNKIIELDEISAYWYRRGNFNFLKKNIDLDIPTAIQKELVKVTKRENFTLAIYLHAKLQNKPHINNYKLGNVNKLKVLREAKKAGLQIPDTIITTNKKTVLGFIRTHQEVISKPIRDIPFSIHDSYVIKYLNKIFTREDISALPDVFSPSLFQKYIPKKYELRIFYLDGDFYSMAIFSQQSEQTSIDFRDYNTKDPNRNIPFKLPIIIEEKIKKLMQSIKLDCGSIDMIVSEEKGFYFLEVNPIGQFGMTSIPCNYYLNRIIAKKLSNET